MPRIITPRETFCLECPNCEKIHEQRNKEYNKKSVKIIKRR